MPTRRDMLTAAIRAAHTPITDDGYTMYDHLTPLEAITAAWTQTGSNPIWHAHMRNEVRSAMPLLAKALDRLTENNQQ